jgi:hypothetical protein
VKRLVTVVVAAFVLLATSGCLSSSEPSWPGAVAASGSPSRVASPSPTPTLTPTPSAPQNPEARVPWKPQGLPVHIAVVNPDGKLIIDADMFGEGLDPLGNLNPGYDGTHEGQAAWFNEGSRVTHPPGFPGSAIIAGHATTHGGVFNALSAVTTGAIIVVRYSSGDEVKFIVTKVVLDLKTDVTNIDTPLGREIWGESSTTVAWLIACDLTTQLVNGHRLGNVVVQGILL